MSSFLIQVILAVSILTSGVFTGQVPSQSVEDYCTGKATDDCRLDLLAITSTYAFRDCWTRSYDDCVSTSGNSGGGGWNRVTSGCLPQDHTVIVCYDEADGTEVCVAVVYEVHICL